MHDATATITYGPAPSTDLVFAMTNMDSPDQSWTISFSVDANGNLHDGDIYGPVV
jgi:hypothetical protein